MSVTFAPDGDDQWLVKFTDVYLSYPHLFEPYRPKKPQIDQKTGKPKAGKYGAKFCFDRSNPENKEDALAIHKKIVEMAKAKFKQGLAADRYCLRDGKQLTEDMHPYFVLSASESEPPIAVDRRRKKVTAEDELFYSGCKVNGWIRLWLQDDQDYGKRVNANLVGVQFLAHNPNGERWGGRPKPKPEELFDDISDQFGDDEYAGVPGDDKEAATAGFDDGFGDEGFGDEDDGLGG